MVKDGVVRTPALEAALLAGITRDVVFELGSAVSVKVEETLLKNDLFNPDDAFFTSTTKN